MMNERKTTYNALNMRGLINLPLTLIKAPEYCDVTRDIPVTYEIRKT